MSDEYPVLKAYPGTRIYNDRRNLCFKVACGDYLIKSLPHVRRYHCCYVVHTYSTKGLRILLSTHALTYFFMISRTKYTKNVLVGSLAALVRDEIHCNEYPVTRRVMRDGYPGSKFSTRFNPSIMLSGSSCLHTCMACTL